MNNFSEDDIRRMAQGETVSPDTPIRTITIGIPHIETRKGQAYQLCKVTLGDIEKEIFFSVDVKYADYLCHERGDAYLIGLLNLAMRERCDIHSEVPLTSELVHQLETELIPSLTKYSSSLYSPKITGVLDNTLLPSAGKIATGCSCGVDALHAIKCLSDTRDGMYKPDYLAINNVGAYTCEGKTSSVRYDGNVSNAQNFAMQYGVPLIVTNSNFANVFPQEHLRTHLYSSCFAVFMLRKLWSRYYYASSGCDIETYFGLTNNELYDSAKYDLIALPAFSIPQLRICNEGNHVGRFKKTKQLTDYKLAHNYLNVCLRQGKGNCGLCSKCTRTLWTLDALGALDNFTEVFPIEQYKKNRQRYLQELYLSHLNGIQMIDEAYAILKKDIPFIIKLKVIIKRRLQNTLSWRILRHIRNSFIKR